MKEVIAAADRALAKLEAVEQDFSRIPEPLAHFIRVYLAQGVIDNGGYRYFFEADWPGKPDYRVFIHAYAAIGCVRQTEDLRRVVESFGFEEPHLHVRFRNAFIEEHYDPDQHHVPLWGDALCGDEEVWDALGEYAEKHAALF